MKEEIKPKKYKCKGGPYDGLKLRLFESGTIEFKLGGFKGYYDIEMNWVDTSK